MTSAVLESSADRSSRAQLAEFIRHRHPAKVTWFDVVDDWLEQDLVAGLGDAGYRMRADDVLETPNFLTDRSRIDSWFADNPARMHDFYVWQRRRLGRPGRERGSCGREVVVRCREPEEASARLCAAHSRPLRPPFRPAATGTFDLESLTADPGEAKGDQPGEPSPDVVRAIEWVAKEFPAAPGDPHLFAWPTSADEARRAPPGVHH